MTRKRNLKQVTFILELGNLLSVILLSLLSKLRIFLPPNKAAWMGTKHCSSYDATELLCMWWGSLHLVECIVLWYVIYIFLGWIWICTLYAGYKLTGAQNDKCCFQINAGTYISIFKIFWPISDIGYLDPTWISFKFYCYLQPRYWGGRPIRGNEFVTVRSSENWDFLDCSFPFLSLFSLFTDPLLPLQSPSSAHDVTTIQT